MFVHSKQPSLRAWRRTLDTLNTANSAGFLFLIYGDVIDWDCFAACTVRYGFFCCSRNLWQRRPSDLQFYL